MLQYFIYENLPLTFQTKLFKLKLRLKNVTTENFGMGYQHLYFFNYVIFQSSLPKDLNYFSFLSHKHFKAHS